MKNCEGMTGIRNRLLRAGAEFSGKCTAGASPSGAAHVIAGTGQALPEITGIVQFLWEVLTNFSQRSFGQLRHVIPQPPSLWHPPAAITPEKVLQHHRKAQGRLGGGTGTVPSDTR